MLARREYSKAELRGRLGSKGMSPETLETVLDNLADTGLQSDSRFAEGFVHARLERGYGPIRIRHELQRHGVDESLVQTCLEEYAEVWPAQARAAKRKRFGEQPPADFKDRARQARFLAYRGLTQEHIEAALENREVD